MRRQQTCSHCSVTKGQRKKVREEYLWRKVSCSGGSETEGSSDNGGQIAIHKYIKSTHCIP